jgi:hypothetical protein
VSGAATAAAAPSRRPTVSAKRGPDRPSRIVLPPRWRAAVRESTRGHRIAPRPRASAARAGRSDVLRAGLPDRMAAPHNEPGGGATGGRHGRLLRRELPQGVHPGRLLRDRLPLAPRDGARRAREPERRRHPPVHPRHLERALPLEVRGGPPLPHRQDRDRRDQRHGRPADHHPQPPRGLRARHGGEHHERGPARHGGLPATRRSLRGAGSGAGSTRPSSSRP